MRHRAACQNPAADPVSVRTDGDWESWLDFFAEAVAVTAGQAVETVQRLEVLARQDRERIHGLRRAAASALRVHHELLRRPVFTSRAIEKQTGLSHVTVNKTLDYLCRLGLARELTGHKRNRVFSYPAYLAILNEGTELPGEVPARRNCYEQQEDSPQKHRGHRE